MERLFKLISEKFVLCFYNHIPSDYSQEQNEVRMFLYIIDYSLVSFGYRFSMILHWISKKLADWERLV